MKSLSHSKKSGFTVMEIMIVVFVIGLIAAMAFPYYRTHRETTVTRIINNNLIKIEYAKFQYAIDQGAQVGDAVSEEQLMPYLKKSVSDLFASDGAVYVLNPIGTDPVYTKPSGEVVTLPTAASL